MATSTLPDTTPKKKLSETDKINLTIGIVGIIATIIVGIVTYLLTENSNLRRYQESIRTARQSVLVTISENIGDGIILGKEKIQLILNSACRDNGIATKDFPSAEIIIDDLIAKVLSDEFLNPQIKDELTNKLFLIKSEKIVPQNTIFDNQFLSRGFNIFSPLGLAFLVSTITATLLILWSGKLKRTIMEEGSNDKKIRETLSTQLIIISLALILLVIAAVIFLQWIQKI